MKLIILVGLMVGVGISDGRLCAAVGLRESSVQDEPALNIYLENGRIDSAHTIESLMHVDNGRVRSAIYRSISREIKVSSDLNDRRELTELFVRGIFDSYASSYVMNRLFLPPFEESFFTRDAISNILVAENGEWSRSDYIKVLGVVTVSDGDIDAKLKMYSRKMGPREENLLSSIGAGEIIYQNSVEWAGLLVKARRGDAVSLENVLSYVGSMSDRKLLWNPGYLEDLGYLRQPEAVDMLAKFLFKDVPAPSEQLKGDTRFIPLAERAARALSLALENYPFGYWDVITEARLEAAREYIKNYKGPWRIIGRTHKLAVSGESEEITKLLDNKPEKLRDNSVKVDTPADENNNPVWVLSGIGMAILIAFALWVVTKK